MLPFRHLTETRLRVMIPSEEAIRDAKCIMSISGAFYAVHRP